MGSALGGGLAGAAAAGWCATCDVACDVAGDVGTWLTSNALQFIAHFGAGGVPIVGLTREQCVEQRGKPVRQRWTQTGEVGWVAVQARQRCVGVGLAEEWHSASEALVEHETQRVEVGAPVQLATTNLLG